MHSVHGPYGTPEDFAVLVDAAHARGNAVWADRALHPGRGGGDVQRLRSAVETSLASAWFGDSTLDPL